MNLRIPSVSTLTLKLINKPSFQWPRFHVRQDLSFMHRLDLRNRLEFDDDQAKGQSTFAPLYVTARGNCRTNGTCRRASSRDRHSADFVHTRTIPRVRFRSTASGISVLSVRSVVTICCQL